MTKKSLFLCGALAGTVGQVVAYPIDTIRRRMQVQGFGPATYQYGGSIRATMRQIVREEGVRGLYKGMTANLCKVAPAVSISFVTVSRTPHICTHQHCLLCCARAELRCPVVSVRVHARAAGTRGIVIAAGAAIDHDFAQLSLACSSQHRNPIAPDDLRHLCNCPNAAATLSTAITTPCNAVITEPPHRGHNQSESCPLGLHEIIALGRGKRPVAVAVYSSSSGTMETGVPLSSLSEAPTHSGAFNFHSPPSPSRGNHGSGGHALALLTPRPPYLSLSFITCQIAFSRLLKYLTLLPSSRQSAMTTRGGPMGDGYHHRSAFKKAPKQFKGHSKGKTDRDNRGKTDSSPSRAPTARARAPPSSHPPSKAVRLLRSKQLQQQRRLEVVEQKRIGSQRGPPRVVALIPLNASVDSAATVRLLTDGCQSHVTSMGGRVHRLEWTSGGKAKRVVVYDTPRCQHAILDIAKTADLICFLVSHPPSSPSTTSASAAPEGSESGQSTLSLDASPHLHVDDFGRHALTIIKAQGLPSTLGLLAPPPPDLSLKAQGLYRRTAQRFFATAIGEDCRVVGWDSGADGLRRWLVEGRLKPIGWRDSRCHLLGVDAAYDAERRVLRVTGWLRGERALNVNGLVHVTGHGDYQVEKVEGRRERRAETRPSTPGSRRSSRVQGMEVEAEGDAEEEARMDDDPAAVVILAESTAESRDSLVSLNPIDPASLEQSLITDEELAESGANAAADDDPDIPPPRKRHVPGEADHQQAWDEALGWTDDAPLPSSASQSDPADPDASHAEKAKLERDEAEYPDEVSVPPGTVYRERFAAYRGLKSMRDSEWDVRLDLPADYARIFTFADFKHSRAIALRDGLRADDGDGWVVAQRQSPVTLSLLDVDGEVAAALVKGTTPLVVFALLAHEHKVSVAHCALQRQAEYAAPLKAKERVEVHCGFRRFTTQPIYSHYTPAHTTQGVGGVVGGGGSQRSRALVERFFHPGRYTTASFYSRIMYPPAPVLMFPAPAQGTGTCAGEDGVIVPVVAVGSLTAVDPDRLLLKRVILTGTAVSCRGREAVVHAMFETPADVEYFKPVALWTKRGLAGHIKQSHGLHGHMVCEFDHDVTQSDTVCMSLYKRQFCKLDPAYFGTH